MRMSNVRCGTAALVLAVTCASAAVPGIRPPNAGQRKAVSFETLKQEFKCPDMLYAPFMFWFWDEPLNPGKMAEMSRVMCSAGFNPGYAHGRNNMVKLPNIPADDWLGDAWFRTFDSALKEAEKQNCFLGYCDEYWWPSFQAKGRVLKQYPELKAESLSWQSLDAAGGAEVKVPASFFAVAAQLDKPAEVKPPVRIQLGKWIWHPDASKNAHTCWLRKTIEIPAGKKITSATLRMTADDAFVLYLNGKQVGAGSDWNTVESIDLSAALLTGKNVLAVKARNEDHFFGLMAGMTIKFDDSTVMEIPSDTSWLSSLSASAGSERVECDTATWAAAREIAAAGDAPWGPVASQNNYTAATIRSKTLRVIGAGEAFSWKAPQQGGWRVYVFNKFFHPGAFDGQPCNSIDERLAPAFIKLAIEPYAERFGNRMGKSIPGDFIDHEGDYGWQLAWSDSLDRRFKERHGRDIRLSLPLMLDVDAEGLYARARWEWFDLVSDLYAGTFRAITDWHEQRGMYTTGHTWEEGIPPQVNCVGDHMKVLRAFTMPGQDCLGRSVLRVHDFKEVASVAEFQNTRATTELMGAGGFLGGDPAKPWRTFTPTFLKQAINAVTAWGMSHIIPHGVFTSRKLTGNPWLPDWYSENPMFPYLNVWTGFARRASYINSMGCAVPDVLLYNPMESAWIAADAPLLDVNGMWNFEGLRANGKKINAINQVYSAAITDLAEARVEFLVGDRFYVNQMAVKNGRLVRGDFSFRTLVLPAVEILTLETARKMLDFAKAGGRVYALGGLPGASAENGTNDPLMKALMEELQALPVFSACPEGLKAALAKSAPGLESPVQFDSGEFKMLQQRRRIDGKDFFWLVNNSETNQTCEVRISGVKGAAAIWDCETGGIRPVSSTVVDNGSRVTLRFKPLEAYWLVIDPALPASKVSAQPEMKEILAVTGPWKVTFDAAIQPVMEYPATPPAEFATGVEKMLEDWKGWVPEKFSGLMDYTKTVTVDKVDEQTFLDLGKVCHAAEVWVNGKPVGQKLWGPYVFDVSGALRPGKNVFRVRVANLINNSYGDLLDSGLLGPVRLETVVRAPPRKP